MLGRELAPLQPIPVALITGSLESAMQYQTLRSVTDNHVFVICYEAGLRSCPIMSAIKAHGRQCIAGRSRSSRQTTAARTRRLRTRHVRARGVQARGVKLRWGGLVRRSGLPQCWSTD